MGCGEKNSNDIYRIVLDSENPRSSTETKGQYDFDIKMTNVPTNYERYILYVDDFCCRLKGLTTASVQVKVNLINQNSYNSGTGGMNTTIVPLILNPNNALDEVLQYQGNQTPYHITNLPSSIALELCDITGTGIDFSGASNYWSINLRIEAE
jgi:hypothetical protein